MKTRNGIYYDLNVSKYKFRVPDTKLTFIFSSDLHLTKFEDRYLKHREDQNIKLIAKYRLNIEATVLPDLILYKKIESRGFLVICEGGQKLCQENLILNGEKVMRRS